MSSDENPAPGSGAAVFSDYQDSTGTFIPTVDVTVNGQPRNQTGPAYGYVTGLADGSYTAILTQASGGIVYVVTAQMTVAGTGATVTINSAVVTVGGVTSSTVARTVQTIARFLNERNNQILSNEPDTKRQIDRLNSFGGGSSGRGQGASFAAAAPAAGQRSAGFTSTGGSSAGNAAARFAVGPDGTDFARSFGGSTGGRGAFGLAGPRDTLADRLGFGDNPDGAAGLPGPVGITGNNDGPARLNFSASLSSVTQAAAEADKRKFTVAGLGVAPGVAGGDLARFNPLDVWIEGKYAGLRDSRGQRDIDGHFGLLSIGADYVLNRSLLVGTMVQIDSTHQRSDAQQTDVKGRGFLVGPYATVRLTDQVFLQGRAAWGRSNNEVSPFLTYSNSFGTERWLVAGTLTGRWSDGPWTWSPAASVSYIEDRSDSYFDTTGAIIPRITSHLGQAKAGPEVSYTFNGPGGAIVEPHAAAQLIWNFDGGATAAGIGTLGDVTGPSGARGRVELGVKSTAPSGIALDLTGSYDGIGSSGYSAVTGRAVIRVPFD